MAEALDFLHGGRLVDTLPLFKKRHLQRDGAEIFHGFALPDMLRIKNLIGLGIVDDFIMQRDYIGNGLTAVAVVETPQLLEIGVSDFGDVLADLDARHDTAVLR